jgi:hypothetical protein
MFATLAFSSSGCRTGDLASATGQYDGYLTEKTGNRTEQVRVAGEVVSTSSTSLSMKVRALDGSRDWTLGISANARGSVWLAHPLTGDSVPHRPTDDSCYVSDGDRVCFDGKAVVVDLKPGVPGKPELSFVMDRTDPSRIPALEPPADYKVSQLLDRAMSQNFSSQVEFEHVVQAKLASRNAHMNLLPHFSTGTVLGIVSLNMTSLVRSIGDLAPFLLPTRWFRARESGFKSDAEHYAFILMKADSANIAEGLSYAISRDNLSIARMAAHRDSIAQVREYIHGRERLGLLPPGSTDDIDSTLVAVDKALLLLRQTLAQEYTDLAQATGFFNPAAIRSVVIDTPSSIDQPVTVDPDQVSRLALERSYEVRQMDSLIAAAQANRGSRYFNWLDPAGSDDGAIGFGFGSYLAIGASQVREMTVRRQQLQSMLLQKVANTTTELQGSIEARSLALRSIEIGDARVKRLLDSLRLGLNISLTDLTLALQNQMRADLDLVDAEFGYLVAYSKIKRVLYEDAYSKAAQQAP